MADRYYFRLSDPTLEAAFLALPARSRNETIVRALRQYLLPGGWVDVLARLDTLETLIRTQARSVDPVHGVPSVEAPTSLADPAVPDMTDQWAVALQALVGDT